MVASHSVILLRQRALRSASHVRRASGATWLASAEGPTRARHKRAAKWSRVSHFSSDSKVLAPALIGSWVVNVAEGATPAFTALQTFHRGGTVDETSDLLGQGGEGPGHGAWERTPDGYAVTFELFIFEPNGAPAGRIRVRETITLTGDGTFTGFSVADLILPDGTLIEKIDGAPITGTRIDVRAVRAEEIGSPVNAIVPRKR